MLHNALCLSFVQYSIIVWSQTFTSYLGPVHTRPKQHGTKRNGPKSSNNQKNLVGVHTKRIGKHGVIPKGGSGGGASLVKVFAHLGGAQPPKILA